MRKKGGQPIESIYCKIGCNQALHLFTNKSKSEIGNPSAPFLAGDDSLHNDSIALQWKTSPHHNASYLIQFRYSQLSSDWIFYRPETPIRDDHILVKGLQPYTAYRFRVLWLLDDVANLPQTSNRQSSPLERMQKLRSNTILKNNKQSTERIAFDYERLQPIYSDESVEIRTLAYGKPSVPPRIIGCLALGPNRVLITYEPPRFPNDRLVSFALSAYPLEKTPNQIESADQLLRDIKAPSDDLPTQHYTLTGLQSNRTYSIRMSAINRFGTGPFASINCTTPVDPSEVTSIKSNVNTSNQGLTSTDPQEPLLVFATPKTVVLKRSSFSAEPAIPLIRLDDFTKDESFTAIAVHVQRGLVFTADTSGSIRRLQLQKEVKRKIINREQLLLDRHQLYNAAQVRVLDMTVDWLNDRLYILRQIRWPSGAFKHNNMHAYSAYSEEIELLRCNLEGLELRPLLRFDYGELPVNMQIDPINGYLFWSAVNNYHHLPHLKAQQFDFWWMENASYDESDEGEGLTGKRYANKQVPSITSSLYRMDLALLNVNHTISSALGQSIVKIKSPQAPAFTVSPNEMRVFYVRPLENQTTVVMSIMLDGSDPIDVREDRIESSQFQPKMRSLALFNHLLFWIAGNETFREHFHLGRYYHNAIFVDQRYQPLLALRLAHPSLQPHPRPISPVTSLQALLLQTDVKIRWQQPSPLFGTGQGAFARWKYELCMIKLNASKTTLIDRQSFISTSTRSNQISNYLTNEIDFWPSNKTFTKREQACVLLNETFCSMGQLKSNTSYVFRVRALSSAGEGPWSNGFLGTTLPELPSLNWRYRAQTGLFANSESSSTDPLYLATNLGLLRSNLLGEVTKTVLLPGVIQRQSIRHLAFYQQHLYANLQNGSLLQIPLNVAHNTHSIHAQTRAQTVGQISGASCIAIDWLTPKLYFANEAQQTISRCNMNGSSVEILPLFSTVKELRIDSLNAFMYWSTGHSVEVATLNALNKFKYFQTSMFSGNSVQGLALDHNEQKLYFLVKTAEQTVLYKGKLATSIADFKSNEPLYSVHSNLPASFSLNGPMLAYSKKLMWLSNDNRAIVTDQFGFNMAVISDKQEVHSIALIDSYEQMTASKLPAVPIVTPDLINSTSIKIDGKPSNFTISWQAVRNVNVGTVRYELLLETQEKLFEIHLDEPKYQYPANLNRSSSTGSALPVFKIAIRVYTTWAYSRRTVIFPITNVNRANSNGNKLIYFEPPRRPSLTKLVKITAGVYELTWTCESSEHSSDSSDSNESNIPIVYAVFRKPVSGDRWTIVYNGTRTRTHIHFPSDELKQSHLIKLIASNQFGESDPLHYNLNPSLDELIESQQSFDRSVMMVLFAVVVTLVVAGFIFYYWLKFVCKQTNEKSKLNLNHLASYANTELATLSNYPIGTAPSSGSNQNHLYLSSEVCSTDTEMSSLSQVCQVQRDQLELIRFLGSGAFGEVFQGYVRYSNGSSEKVAIKTLRDNSQRNAFLKEARLMENFKHPHILRLVGICLTNEPMCLLLELMDGGDLLSFLRSNRPVGSTPSPLSLAQLVEMCVHVADGCCYLEQKHFVHRDLAARNCLVSTDGDELSGRRVVKIGDFGLTRDLYKADYYRKEGEGLLPVRWMPPESLVDGVFTTQSDVWSFGVLLWEVCTLGQQPYPARSNVEVLGFVQNGGRLDRPDTCPQELFDLMVQCWNFNPKERPSFAYCLHVLQSMSKRLIGPNQVTSVHNQNYIYSANSGESVNLNGSNSSTVCKYSIGKKADLIEVNSLRLLKPENLTTIDLNECDVCLNNSQDRDGYELPVEVMENI